MSNALSFAEVARQQVELLPARTVMSTGGVGGSGNYGGDGYGGHGGDATAVVFDNYNFGDTRDGDVTQYNLAIAVGGDGGDGYGGVVFADGVSE